MAYIMKAKRSGSGTWHRVESLAQFTSAQVESIGKHSDRFESFKFYNTETRKTKVVRGKRGR